jgi:hypothetical protein
MVGYTSTTFFWRCLNSAPNRNLKVVIEGYAVNHESAPDYRTSLWTA